MSRTHLTADELQTYRRQLQQLTARLSGEVAELEAEALRPAADAADAPAHEADPPARVAEEEVARTVLASEEHILGEARAALERIAAGAFGTCEECGAVIAKVRLNALPYARTCTSCAREGTGAAAN